MPKRESWIKRLAASIAVMVMLSAGAFNTFAAEENPPENAADALEKAREEAESFIKIQDALKGEDAVEALKDLEFLARKGNVKARLLLGDLYLAGEKVIANDSMAWQWYKRAAEKDSLKGQFMVAELYRMGLGVPFSLSNAAKWYKKAAEKGHVESQKMLGQIFAGKLGGGLIDFRKAEQWLAKAAEQGDFDSELTLYQMYDGGYKPMSTLDQELSDEETDPNASAGRIRKTLLDALNKRAPIGGELEVQGLLRVREAGDGWFNVSIPPIRLTNASGGAFSIGRAKFRFKPIEDQLDAAGEPRAYQVAEVDLNLVRFKPKLDGAEYIITYKVKRFTGIWRPELNAFSESDAELSDVMIRDSEKSIVFKAARVANIINLTESAPGVWGGSSWMELGGITISEPGGPVRARLQSAAVDYVLKGLDPKALEAKFAGMLQPKSAAAKKSPPVTFSASAKASLNKAEILDMDGATLGGVDGVTFEFAADLDFPRLTFGFSYAHGGAFSDTEDEASGYLPLKADGAFKIERLPLDGLLNVVLAGFMMGVAESFSEPTKATSNVSPGAAPGGKPATGKKAQTLGGPAVDSLLAQDFSKSMFRSLEKSKTRISAEASFDALKAALRAKGALKADAKALYGFSGGFDVMARGLEDYIEASARKPGQAAQTLILTMIHELANAQPAPDGAPLATYYIELTRKGKLLVNGKDMIRIYRRIMAAMPPDAHEPEKEKLKPKPEPEPPIQEEPQK